MYNIFTEDEVFGAATKYVIGKQGVVRNLRQKAYDLHSLSPIDAGGFPQVRRKVDKQVVQVHIAGINQPTLVPRRKNFLIKSGDQLSRHPDLEYFKVYDNVYPEFLLGHA